MTHLLRRQIGVSIAAFSFLWLGASSLCAQKISHIAPPPLVQQQFSDLTSAAADPADAVCARYAAGSTVTDPVNLSSTNGQLEVTFHYQTTIDQAGLTRYCYAYTDSSGNVQEAPTLHVNPGDQLIIHFYNDLPAAAAGSAHKMMMMKPMAAAAGSNPYCNATTVDSSSSNMHFHGTTVAPVCGQDEVVHTIVPSQGEFDYNVQIPSNAPSGLFWYHPHPHGFSDIQTIGGASGAIIIDGVQNVNSATAGLPARVLMLRDQNLPSTDSGSNEPATDLSLNYIPITYPAYTPAVLPTPPSEKEFWRVLNASADTLVDLQVQVGGTPQPLQIVSVDGVPLTDSSGNATTTTVTDYVIPSAGRVEFIVTTPAAGANAQLVTLSHNNGPDGDADPERPLAQIDAVAGTAPPPALPAQTTTAQAIRNPTPVTINKRTLYFSVASDFSAFYITENGAQPKVFNMDDPPAITVQGGTVEQWTIENHSQLDHSFHMHQLHFQVVGANNYPSGVPVPASGPTLLDTIDIPYWPGGSAPYPSVTLLMDFRDPNIVGTFVYHCHILSHEDLGMMAAIQVTPGSSTVAVSSSASTSPLGAAVTLTANVAAASGVGTPTGTVTFSNGTTSLGTATIDGSGNAALTTTSLPLGAASITAAYSGSRSFLTSTSSAVPLTISAATTATALSVSPANPAAGTKVTFTAVVTDTSGSGTPTGTVTFSNGSAALATVALDGTGTATYATSSLPIGSTSVAAAYSGSSSFAASTSSVVPLTISPAITATALTASPTSITAGASVTLTATVSAANGSGTPAGTVTFANGATTLGTAALNTSGVATYTTNTLPVGTASVTATYGGSSSFAASTSSAVMVTVIAPVPPTFSVSATSVTVTPGATTGNTSTVTLTPANGFTGAINLTATLTSSPSGAANLPTIALSASSVTISGTTPATATATINTTASSTAAVAYPGIHRWYTAAGGAALACLIFFGVPARRRGWKTTLGLLLFAISMVAVGCGGGSMNSSPSNPGTTAGSYTFTVTGTDAATGKVTANGTIGLTVN